jgi:hypothetical protein
MIRQHRQSLLQGPRITIYIRDFAVIGIAKRLAMALSPVLNEHFASDPTSLEFHLNAVALEPLAVHTLLVEYPETTANHFRAGEVGFQGWFRDDVAILSASRVFGMQMYTTSILATYLRYLDTTIPEYSEVIAVEQLRTSDDDPLWTTMIKHLARSRHQGRIPDPREFARFLEEYTQIKDAMASADRYFQELDRNRREAAGREFEERRRRWMWELAQGAEGPQRELAMAASRQAQPYMGVQSGEAAFRRRR